MAVYKVIQDVEAEDKLLGPLTLKSFIYAAIAALCAFIEYRLLLVGSPLKWLFIMIFFGPMALFGVLASPLGRDQPTEVWLLSRIRFFLKPHRRIWNQDGQQELVTVTAPKKIELHLTKDLSQTEVQSRLKTLASTLDTRGWAIKNADVNEAAPQAEVLAVKTSDRLVGDIGVPVQVSRADVKAADDIMDAKNNPVAQKFEALMEQAEAERRHGLLAKLRGLGIEKKTETKPVKKTRKSRRSAEPNRHNHPPAAKNVIKTLRKETAAEKAEREAKEKAEIEAKLAKARGQFNATFTEGHVKPNPRHQVVGPNWVPQRLPGTPSPQMTTKHQADNMELAQSGSAFSVATVSKLANRQPPVQQTGPDEVTVSLH